MATPGDIYIVDGQDKINLHTYTSGYFEVFLDKLNNEQRMHKDLSILEEVMKGLDAHSMAYKNLQEITTSWKKFLGLPLSLEKQAQLIMARCLSHYYPDQDNEDKDILFGMIKVDDKFVLGSALSSQEYNDINWSILNKAAKEAGTYDEDSKLKTLYETVSHYHPNITLEFLKDFFDEKDFKLLSQTIDFETILHEYEGKHMEGFNLIKGYSPKNITPKVVDEEFTVIKILNTQYQTGNIAIKMRNYSPERLAHLTFNLPYFIGTLLNFMNYGGKYNFKEFHKTLEERENEYLLAHPTVTLQALSMFWLTFDKEEYAHACKKGYEDRIDGLKNSYNPIHIDTSMVLIALNMLFPYDFVPLTIAESKYVKENPSVIKTVIEVPNCNYDSTIHIEFESEEKAQEIQKLMNEELKQQFIEFCKDKDLPYERYNIYEEKPESLLKDSIFVANNGKNSSIRFFKLMVELARIHDLHFIKHYKDEVFCGDERRLKLVE